MTREKAINYLKPIADSASLPRYAEALNMAISALREHEERSKGCEFCAETLKRFDHVLAVADYCEDDIVYEPRFCPMCGRRLEDA